MIWGTDMAYHALTTGQTVYVFVVVDHCTAECLGLSVSPIYEVVEALRPIADALDHYRPPGRLHPTTLIRHDHGSAYVDRTFRDQLEAWGLEPSPTRKGRAADNGCAERFIRTLRDNLLRLTPGSGIQDCHESLIAFRNRYNTEWLIERHGYCSPESVRKQHTRPP